MRWAAEEKESARRQRREWGGGSSNDLEGSSEAGMLTAPAILMLELLPKEEDVSSTKVPEATSSKKDEGDAIGGKSCSCMKSTFPDFFGA